MTVVLTLAMFLGNDIRTLPPILDSYWRPIHVSIATIGYGVCLVSFGLAFAYLLKDGIRTEAIAIAGTLYGLLVFFTIGRFAVPFRGEYGVSVMLEKTSLPIRTVLPLVGPLMVLTLIALVLALAFFVYHFLEKQEGSRKFAWRAFRTATVLQGVVLIALFYQVNKIDDPASGVNQREYPAFSQWLVRPQNSNEAPPVLNATQQQQIAAGFISERRSQLSISTNSNPVEFGGLIGLFVVLLMISLFAWRKDDVVNAMPSLKTIDSLLYRSVGVAFPLLTLLLITGAVWANESWGRYWGWDSKEVGALVAWMAYAGFLHTRIAHGWKGRRSAYFAMLGFALVIFTWLGVSFLLPGLHSYA